MSSITIPAREEHHPYMRPLSILRDLPAVADLIETCFSATMDSDGRRYVQDMRRAGNDNSFLKWANRVAETTSLPLTGYIWEQDHRIVGNVSLVPFKRNKHRLYLIANVAVHPDYRRRGIARILTERAMQHAREKNVQDIWLHVRADNSEAIHLYETLGFQERTRRTNWQASTDPRLDKLETDIAITSRQPRFWLTQNKWLSRLYPDALGWHANWNFSTLKPGFLNWMYLMFIDVNVRQWAATRKDSLLATLSWIPNGRGDGLFAAAGERSDPEALTALLLHARRDMHYSYPHIALDFPAGLFDDAIQAAGFKSLRTLIWMQAT
ncbi:MAG: GNAT family N-acetyltransferase [Anaerolineales bacterium]|uniref:GNAT family N-acetyltransferase n=1 Tax=Candidatus Villigracilis vicinus TaxID=3140679 RepID=UPI003136FA30|nr:GNAT family N-acetyltransferase [Anaerolineales bacterium]